MGFTKLVICTEDNEVLFAGTSQTAPSGTYVTAESAATGDDEREQHEQARDCLTLPAPPCTEEAGGDYYDDPPTIAREAVRR